MYHSQWRLVKACFGQPYLTYQPDLVRNHRDIDFHWGKGPAAVGLPENNFSVRWSRQLSFKAGVYRFRAQADDGIRFYLDGKLLLDEWHAGSGEKTYKVDATLTGTHKLVVDYSAPFCSPGP